MASGSRQKPLRPCGCNGFTLFMLSLVQLCSCCPCGSRSRASPNSETSSTLANGCPPRPRATHSIFPGLPRPSAWTPWHPLSSDACPMAILRAQPGLILVRLLKAIPEVFSAPLSARPNAYCTTRTPLWKLPALPLCLQPPLPPPFFRFSLSRKATAFF
jgi:hypothetical protein